MLSPFTNYYFITLKNLHLKQVFRLINNLYELNNTHIKVQNVNPNLLFEKTCT